MFEIRIIPKLCPPSPPASESVWGGVMSPLVLWWRRPWLWTPQKFQARVADPTAQDFNLSYSWLGQNMSY